jgi:hypothetical protein
LARSSQLTAQSLFNGSKQVKMSTSTKYTPRLADKYKKEVVPALMKRFSYSSVMQVPRLEKICLNRGVNGAVTDMTAISKLL